MIDYIYGGEYLTVASNKGAQPYINMSSNQPMIGAVSYDPSSQQLKVYDGGSWMSLGGGSASINLSPDAINTLKWAEKKMREEQELKALCDKHPTIKDLVDQMNSSTHDYMRKIEMVKILLKEEEKIATS